MDRSFSQESTAASRRSELFFWGFAVLTLFLFLGHNALSGSEDRWAEISREMLVSGDWLHPSLNWRIYFDKPLLTYWLILPFALLYGGFNEFIVRIPSALAGLAGLWGILLLGRKLFDRRTALLAGWMLLSCYGFLFWARAAAADMANMAAIVLAVAFFYQVEDRAKFYHYFGFYLICFLGAWAKGLPALVMPFVVIAPHLLMEKRWLRHLKISNFCAFIIAAAIFFVPFYFAAVVPMEYPHRLPEGNALSGLELVWRENIVRVFNAFDHKDPIYSYLYNLPRTLLPWAPLIIVVIAGMIRNWKKLPLPVRELMIGTLLMFVLFSCSTSRRWYYILPVVPFCVLIAAAGIGGGWSVAKWDRPLFLLMRLVVIVIGSLGVASLVGIPLWNHFFDFEPPLLLMIALPVTGGLTLAVMLVDRQSESPIDRLTGLPPRTGAMVLGCAIVMAGVFDCVMPSMTKYRTEKQLYRAFAESNSGIVPERILIWRDDAPSKMLFYLDLQRPVEECLGFWTRDLSREEIAAMTPEQRVEAEYQELLSELRAFVEKNAGHRIALSSYDRKSDLELLARAARELNLPIDVEKPDYSERSFEVVKSRSRRRAIWILNLPQESDLRSVTEHEKE